MRVLVELEFRNVGFDGGRKTEKPGEKHSEQGENQQQTQPTYDTVPAHINRPSNFLLLLVIKQSGHLP